MIKLCHLMFMRQSGIWPILCQFMSILAKFLDMDFKFILSIIYINFSIQTNFEVNQTQIGHSIPKITPKITKMAISQNSILPKCDSLKSLLLHYNVNIDFAHTNRDRFLIYASF